MNKDKTQFRYILAGFLLLCGVSLYRKLSLAFLTDDVFRPYIVYVVYVFLLGGWLYSLTLRITQKFMLRCLKVECIVMIFWLTIRLLQETVFYKDILLMRVSGYFIVFPLLVTLLYGAYAAFGLGMGESYRMPRKLFFLLIPDLFLVFLMLTNEYHHIVFKVLPGEDTNLAFHANVGFVVILVFATFLILTRLTIIFRRTRNIKGSAFRKLLPVLTGMGIPLAILPYLVISFLPVPNFELIELTALLYFLECMIWETSIFVGLVPVNTRYGMVFEQSTLGMRIIGNDGETLLKSSHARELTDKQLTALMTTGILHEEQDHIFHIHSITDGYLIYQQDISGINRLIAELEQTAEELKQENTLLSRELASRSEKAAVETQNHIYNKLSDEVGGCLKLMDRIITDAGDSSGESVLKKLCITGTYLKRRCNLRLIEAADGYIDPEELRLSLADIVLCLENAGIRARLNWLAPAQLSPEASVRLLDTAEELIEQYDYSMNSLEITADSDVTLTVAAKDGTIRTVRVENAPGEV